MIQKIVHIVGPTGVGKTDLAVSLAKKFNGQLISADSVQVYKTLDIISGKDIPKGAKFKTFDNFDSKFDLGYYNFSKIPVFLLDVVPSITSFTVHDFKDLADKFISYISSQGKLPIIVGGTGLYTNALVKNYNSFNIPPDQEIRKELEKLDLTSLQKKLKKSDTEKFKLMNNSDVNNPRRLIRAIEIVSNRVRNKVEGDNKYSVLQIGLMAPKDFLKERIDKRVDERLEDGALKEAKILFKNYEKLCQQVKDANGYKQLFSYLKKEAIFDEATYRWKLSEYRVAKNQMTWFKKYGNTIWFDITKKGFKQEIEKEISIFLT